MQSRFEEHLQHDIDQIREKVIKMGGMVEDALRAALKAIQKQDRQIAYSVILKDGYIDQMENELDWLCLKFLVKHQPAATQLRLVYSSIKINGNLERTGDYAEALARQYLTLSALDPQPSYDSLVEMIETVITMIHKAVQSFADQDAKLALETRTYEKSKVVDNMRTEILADLTQQHSEGKLPSSALVPLMTMANRCERVGDQAGNVCEEVLYIYTGEGMKHDSKDSVRILFVDEHDSCRSQMAAGIGSAIGVDRFQFTSAGMKVERIDPKTVEFMAGKGIDVSHQVPTFADQILNIESYQAVISLCREAEVALPPTSAKTVRITWNVADPSRVEGSEAEIQAAYEETYKYLDMHIRDFIQAILGHDLGEQEGD